MSTFIRSAAKDKVDKRRQSFVHAVARMACKRSSGRREKRSRERLGVDSVHKASTAFVDLVLGSKAGANARGAEVQL